MTMSSFGDLQKMSFIAIPLFYIDLRSKRGPCVWLATFVKKHLSKFPWFLAYLNAVSSRTTITILGECEPPEPVQTSPPAPPRTDHVDDVELESVVRARPSVSARGGCCCWRWRCYWWWWWRRRVGTHEVDVVVRLHFNHVIVLTRLEAATTQSTLYWQPTHRLIELTTTPS